MNAPTTAVLHVTTEGERFDQLSYRYYGDALSYERITDANRAVALYPVLPSGLRLLIPVIDQATAATSNSASLPPWKR
ncbi:MAG: tail protein X [Desulfovibrionaceae bacterium]|nr:tail protein X [Desulfovibrionaceae bacterium]MBF0513623.1 tail protein X [Desulfovibrionaceae bacterium]